MIENILEIVKDAGRAIMQVYETDFDVQIKDDSSPVTIADKKANLIIEKGLLKINSSIPILSEEGSKVNFDDRKFWKKFWLVDPLDGTKEFIKKNDEFTVNIALVENNFPTMGVVYAPALGLFFWGGKDYGAWKMDGSGITKKISTMLGVDGKIKIIGSRSHPSKKMKEFLSYFNEYELIKMGSSLKICYVADGSAHLYPRLSPTMEWDIAAAHAILNAADGKMINYGTNEKLRYNKESLLNCEFIAGNKLIINELKIFN